MAVIKLNNLGGLVPMATARTLPDNGAQVANNLLARTTDFRPLLNDTTVATLSVPNPKTLYRMARKADGSFTSDMAQNWIARSTDINFVKGQTNDDRTERTYYTFADGSANPRVMDSLGFDKPLGVPPPATAPSAHANIVYSYTPDQRTTELVTAGYKIVDILRANFIRTWVGIDAPTTNNIWSRAGYITIPNVLGSGETNLDNPERAKAFRVFRVNAIGGTTILNTYTGFAVSAAASAPGVGLFDAKLNGFYGAAVGDYSPPPGAWISYGDFVYIIPIHAYAPTLTFNTSAVVAAMRAIKMPGTNGATQLFTDAQATDLCNWLVAYAGKDSALIKPMIASLKTSFESFVATIDSGRLASVDYAVSRQEELKTLYQNVVDAYIKINEDLPNLVQQFYQASGVDGVVPAGVPRVVEDRFYVCTYVTNWGEESAPSPVSELTELDENDTVTGGPPNPPPGYGITKFRYYRTNTGATGAPFQFVTEVDFSAASLAGLALTTTVDNKKATELGEVCPSTIWLPPPGLAAGTTATPLRGLVGGPNGIMAGFFDNTACFCEPYVPYAYPVEYQIPMEYPIVGIGVFGQTFVFCTQGNPYYITGADSASMNAQKLDSPHACVAALSIASGEGGVVYASPDGLCLGDHNGVRLATEGLFTREDWQRLTPTSIRAKIHENVYYFTYTGNGGGCYALHLESGKLTTVNVTGSTFYRDTLTDRLYVANGTSVVALFSGTTYRTATYRTKIVSFPKYTGFAWLQVQSTFTAPVTVRWYGNGVLLYTAVLTNRDPVRLPLGRCLEHEIEVESSARWDSLTMASSTEELKGI